jgi:hypothetical protein
MPNPMPFSEFIRKYSNLGNNGRMTNSNSGMATIMIKLLLMNQMPNSGLSSSS